MGYFKKEMPLHPDSSLGPVTIGSKIRVEKGEPLPLQEGRVDFVPGQAWDPRYLTISKEMTPDRRKLNIHVSLANTIPLSYYIAVILEQKPIQLRVTLVPSMSLPGMGIPVSVPVAPIVDEVSVTIPAIPQPEIILEGTYVGKTGEGRDRGKVTATVPLPPYILPAEKEELIRNISFDVTDVRHGEVKIDGTSSHTTEKTVELIAIPGPDSPDGRVTAIIRSSVSFHGLLLTGENQLSFECGKKYILNINPGTIDVTMDKKGSFTARVLEERAGNQYSPVEDASLSVEPGRELLEFLTLSPAWAQKELTCTVTQTHFSKVTSVELVVRAKAGDGEVQSGTIHVNVAQESPGDLEVEFDPESKTTVSPFIKGDFVTLKATVKPPFGMPPVHADIEFALANPSGWLKDPRDVSATPGSIAGPTADIGRPQKNDVGEWKSASFYGNIPIPAVKGEPPSMEPVVITAKKDGVVIGREVIQVGLLARPMISVDREQMNFLANADTPREGRPAPVTTEKVTVTVLNPGIYSWNIRVEPTGDTRFISQKEISRTSTSAAYEFTLKNPVPRPENKPEKPGWEQRVTVHTFANLGGAAHLGKQEIQRDVMVQGPDILLRILHEGLFVEATYEYDENGERHESIGKKDLTIKVEVPSEKKYKPPEIKIVALIWDGHDLVPNARVYIDHVREPQESKDRDHKARAMWNTLFIHMKGSISIEFKKKEEVKTTSGDYFPPAVWEVFVNKSIPANGERLRGHVLFFAKKQDDGDLHPDLTFLPVNAKEVESGARNVRVIKTDTTWQLEVPVELILGVPGDIVTEDNIKTPQEEAARCIEIINKSFPPERREDLLKELDALKGKGAGDYRLFSKSIFTQAHKVWEEDQNNYLKWDDLRSWTIWTLEKTEYTGDISFQVLIAYATKDLGPGTAWITSTIATALKKEGLAFYQFHRKRGGAIDVSAQLYVEREWITFLTEVLRSGIESGIDELILKDFTIENVVKDPKKSLRTVGWLWLWKFGLNYHKNPDLGMYEAMKAAGIELGDMLLVKAIEHYVKDQKNPDIKKMFKDARDRGFFGGVLIQVAARPGADGTIAPGQKPGQHARGRDTLSGDEYHPSGTPLGDEYRTFTYKDAPGTHIDTLTKGMTADHVAAAQRIAAEENIDLLIRSTTRHAEELIRTGKADPKPEYVKTKTIDENDVKLSNGVFTDADLGKVGYFEPKMPSQTTETPEEWKKLQGRCDQRAQEYKDQATHIKDHQNLNPASGEKIVVENGKVKKVLKDGTTKDITGDYDVFGVLDGTTGQPIADPARMERIYNRLKNEMDVQHPWQSQWDYRDESRQVPPGSKKGTQSPYDIKRGIDQKIVNSHTEGKDKAEPLIKFSPDGDISGSWIAGVSES